MSVEDTDFDYGALIAESDIDEAALLNFDPDPDELDQVDEAFVEHEEVEPEEHEGPELVDEPGPDDEPAPDSESDHAEAEYDPPEAPELVDPERTEAPEDNFQQARALNPHGAPVVAVCGLNGGAGTTTFSMLLAYAASQQKRGPVLLTDLGGPSASMAAYLSKRGSHSLSSAANAHRAGLFGADGKAPFADLSKDLRLMAREPGLADDELGDPRDPYLYDLLIDAQEDHFASFVDCGRLELPGEVAVAEHATHIIWIVDGIPSAARRARAALQVLPFRGSRSSILVIRIGERTTLSSQTEKDLRLAADAADADMIMCGDVGDVVGQGVARTARNAVDPVKAALRKILQ